MKLFIAAGAIALLAASSFGPFASAAPKKKYDTKATEALLQAALDAEEDAMIAALAANADPNVKGEEAWTPLMYVAAGTFFGDAESLIDALVKAKAELEAKNSFGQTALMLAAREGRTQQLDALIKNGAKVNARDDDGWSALMLAAFNGQHQCVKSLIAAKADVSAKTEDGWDGALLALSEGRGSVARVIVEAGAAVPKDGPGRTAPLIHAVYGGDLEAVRLVLESSPDLTARDSDGWSALEIAANNDYPQIVMELLRAGIDAALKDKEEKTALDRAIESENVEIIALLGGKWDKPSPGGTKISVPCKSIGGNVDGFVEIKDADLLFSTLFPKPMSWYLGGGNTNRAKTAKSLTYDGSVAPSFYLDTDANPKTGQKPDMFTKVAAGAEYSLEYGEMGTSVTITYTDSDGKTQQRNVFGNVFDPTLNKEGDYLDTGDFYPSGYNNNGVLQTTVPMSLVGVKAGQKVRIVFEAGSCGSKEMTVTLK
ncbi:MAG: ankyrin repeat domain-containing protein [Acidobacteria bacterium]|nr:ankyrin repeat domain-containing protein [Acidobacteriota bacterium]